MYGYWLILEMELFIQCQCFKFHDSCFTWFFNEMVAGGFLFMMCWPHAITNNHIMFKIKSIFPPMVQV